MKNFLLSSAIIATCILAFSCKNNGGNTALPEVDDVCSQMDDPSFKSFCLKNFDADSDSKISMAEAASVTELVFPSPFASEESESEWEYDQPLESLKGIEYFPNLKALVFEYHQVTSLDISKNPKLEYLYCSSNRIGSLDVSKNPLLKELSCSSCGLTSLDVSKNTELVNLSCNDNQIPLLDVSNCPKLTDLACSTNQIKTLDISNAPGLEHLHCGNNLLTSLDVRGCTSLEEVDFSEGLLNIGNYAFYGCSSLQRVHLPSTVASVGKYAFGSCTGLLSVVFPSALTAVGDYAFVGCSALQKVDLEPCAGLLTIGASAFSGCTGTTGEDITLPASVTAVGSAALTPFKYVNVLGTTPPVIATDSFIGTARFGVPAQSLKTYKNALNWKKYQNWIYPDTTFCYPPSMTQISADRRQLNLFGVTLDFIKVSAGQYTSGSKTVTLTKDYWLAEAELSRALWIAVMNADPSNFTPTMDIAIHCPVTRVSWEDVFTYISALNRLVPSTYRLPSEAEWEFAARGGNQSQGYTYSGGNVLADVAWYTANSKCCLDTTGAVRQQPHPYGERQANELGFYDMSGNVYEWVNDYWSTSAPSGTDPTGPVNDANKRRVMRGGDYISSEQFCTVSYRTYKKQGENGSNLGFRLAL